MIVATLTITIISNLEITSHISVYWEVFLITATRFAIEMGFKEENLSTNSSLQMWKDWENGRCQPNYRKVVTDYLKTFSYLRLFQSNIRKVCYYPTYLFVYHISCFRMYLQIPEITVAHINQLLIVLKDKSLQNLLANTIMTQLVWL